MLNKPFMKNKYLFPFQLILLFSFHSFSQEAVVSSGNSVVNSNGAVSYSVGQVAYSSQSSTAHSVNEGVQQPFEFYTLSLDAFQKNISLKIYPNPTSDKVFLVLDDVFYSTMNVTLMDMQGKAILKEELNDIENSISLESLPKATYMLNIEVDNQLLNTYKIIKN